MPIDPKENITITVVGLGYIGLPTATLFAAGGFKVFGYEKNDLIVESLKTGKPHIHFQEAGLRELLQSVLQNGNLIPTKEIRPSDFFIICVPTPAKTTGDRKVPDLSFVQAASENVAKVLKKGNMVILESTVPPRTTEDLMGTILADVSGLEIHEDFDIAHCPERVIPGRTLHELRQNDRVIGTSSKRAAQTLQTLYGTIVTGGKIFTTDLVTAEMCKLVENTYRDVNIAFANELSMICEKAGIDVHELIELANRHPRVSILSPGPGVGGHCIAVDPWFIAESFPDETPLIKTARHVNDHKTEWLAIKIAEQISKLRSIGNLKVGILGLAYKADVDDVRESPALKLAVLLREQGFSVLACEPNISQNHVDGFSNLDLDDLLETADYLVLAVPHRQFLDARQRISSRPCFDTVGVLS